MLQFYRKVCFNLSWLLSPFIVFFAFSCAPDFRKDCGREGVSVIPSSSSVAHFFLKSSVSLKSAEELIDPKYISGKSFCLSATEVIYDETHGPLKQPCFNLAWNQVFTGENTYTEKDYFYRRFEVIDPKKFLAYYHSIPKELNKFLVIKAEQYNLILKKSGADAFLSVPASLDFWSEDYENSITMRGLLHGNLVTEEDVYTAIYLPLNQGIRTPEYAGVVPNQPGLWEERNNFTYSAGQLTPAIEKLALNSDLIVVPGCGLRYLDLNAQLKIEDLQSALRDYQNLVKAYWQAHPTAFPYPYATP